MTKVNADLPEGCMQPARTLLEHALAELRRALAMTGGSVDLRFHRHDGEEPEYVTIGQFQHGDWIAHRGYFVSATSFDTFELAKIALTIVPDRVVEKVRCDTCGGSGESAIVVMSRGRYMTMCSKCCEEWRKSPITAAEMERTVYRFVLHYAPNVTLYHILNEVRVSKRHRKWTRKFEWRSYDTKKNVLELPSGMVDSVLKEIRDMVVYREPEKQ